MWVPAPPRKCGAGAEPTSPFHPGFIRRSAAVRRWSSLRGRPARARPLGGGRVGVVAVEVVRGGEVAGAGDRAAAGVDALGLGAVDDAVDGLAAGGGGAGADEGAERWGVVEGVALGQEVDRGGFHDLTDAG